MFITYILYFISELRLQIPFCDDKLQPCNAKFQKVKDFILQYNNILS